MGYPPISTVMRVRSAPEARICETCWMFARVVEASEEQLARASNKYKTREGAQPFKSSQYGLAFVAESEGEIVGWCWGYHLLRPDGTTMVYIHEIEVDSSARRNGYGRGLIEAMLDTARNEGAERGFLVTQKSNTAAMALYESAGAHTPDDGDSLTYWWLLDEDIVRATSRSYDTHP